MRHVALSLVVIWNYIRQIQSCVVATCCWPFRLNKFWKIPKDVWWQLRISLEAWSLKHIPLPAFAGPFWKVEQECSYLPLLLLKCLVGEIVQKHFEILAICFSKENNKPDEKFCKDSLFYNNPLQQQQMNSTLGNPKRSKDNWNLGCWMFAASSKFFIPQGAKGFPINFSG